MRYQTFAKGETTYLIGYLPSGETVTIAMYDLSTGNAVTLTSNSCSEIGSSGHYRWGSSNITTQPTAKTEYLYIMTAAASGESFSGKFVLGGYVDNLALEESVQVINGLATDIRRVVKNKLSMDKTNSKLQLWNDAGEAVLYEWPLTDIDGNPINIGAGIPANRGVVA